MNENEIAKRILDGAFRVHTKLGPGLLESAYKEWHYFELIRCGLLVEKEKSLPLIYEDVKLDCGYRIDLLIEKRVVVEVKSGGCPK